MEIQPELYFSKLKVASLLTEKAGILRITDIEGIVRGSTNLVFKIFTEKENYFLKISHRPDRNQGSILEKEARILRATETNNYGIPIPKIIWQGTTQEGWPAILETALEGERIEDIISSTIETGPAAEQLGIFTAKWHENKHHEIDEFETGRPSFPNFTSYATHWLEDWKPLCERAPHIELKDVQTAYKHILTNLHLFSDTEWSYVHADISKQNVLGKVEDNTLILTGVCDFENFQTGPLEYEFATIDDGIFLFYPEWEKPFKVGYETISKLPQNFTERYKIINLFRALRYIKRSVKYNETHYFEHDAKYFSKWLPKAF